MLPDCIGGCQVIEGKYSEKNNIYYTGEVPNVYVILMMMIVHHFLTNSRGTCVFVVAVVLFNIWIAASCLYCCCCCCFFFVVLPNCDLSLESRILRPTCHTVVQRVDGVRAPRMCVSACVPSFQSSRRGKTHVHECERCRVPSKTLHTIFELDIAPFVYIVALRCHKKKIVFGQARKYIFSLYERR